MGRSCLEYPTPHGKETQENQGEGVTSNFGKVLRKVTLVKRGWGNAREFLFILMNNKIE